MYLARTVRCRGIMEQLNLQGTVERNIPNAYRSTIYTKLDVGNPSTAFPTYKLRPTPRIQNPTSHLQLFRT